jgi:site-specific recombinase XerD
MDYRAESPEVLRRFLTYTETIRGKSKRTAEEYFLDLRMFFRYLKRRRGLVPPDAVFDEIRIDDVDIGLLERVTLMDVYDYMAFLNKEREFLRPGEKSDGRPGIGNAARARKVASLRSFFKYLTVKAMLIKENPVAELDAPKLKRSLPRYLSLEESVSLLSGVTGENAERDYLILTLFLNCGIRVSELVGINLADIKNGALTVTGKGNKERVVFLNDACRSAVEAYLPARGKYAPDSEPALFVTERKKRISPVTVKWLVKKHLGEAGLDTTKYSAHKLRHTAATLMYQNGVDVLTLKEILGHEQLNTTQIYTHLSNEDARRAADANPLSRVKKNKG